MLACEFLFALMHGAQHHVETAHQAADLVVRSHLGAARVVTALGRLHGVHEIQQRLGDLLLHAARHEIGQRQRHHRAAEQDGQLHDELFLQLGEIGAHVQMADDLALVGDRVDQVQGRETIEAMLMLAAFHGLRLPLLQRCERGPGVGDQHGLAARVVHEHALVRVAEQRFFDVGFDAQRADQRFGLAEVLALDGGGAAARDHARHGGQVVVGLAVTIEIGGDALRQRREE